MDERTKAELDSIFDTRAAEKESQEVAARQREERAVAHVARFRDHRESVIKPVLAEFGEYLVTRGHAYRISQREDGDPRTDRLKHNAAITLRIFPEGNRTGAEDDFPSITFSCDRNSGTVDIHESTMQPGRGGRAGSAGRARLEEVTEAFVRTRVLKLIGEVF